MNLSLNEVEGAAKKATRGAGYPWGLSEEAGKAVRWLCARDLDGCGALAGLLKTFEGLDVSKLSPTADREIWQAKTGPLCPLATGAAVSDRAERLLAEDIRIGRVAEHSLLFAFAAYAAQKLGSVVGLMWPGGSASSDGEDLSYDGTLGTSAEWVVVSAGAAMGRATARRTRANASLGSWQTLNGLASRTYAPATKESRLRGAGAGLSDND